MEEEGTTQVDIPAAVNTRVSLQVQARITFGSLIQLRVLVNLSPRLFVLLQVAIRIYKTKSAVLGPVQMPRDFAVVNAHLQQDFTTQLLRETDVKSQSSPLRL